MRTLATDIMLANPNPTNSCNLQQSGFTLFEVMIALAVFAIAVTGLMIALDGIVDIAIDARERALSRIELESRLAYNMVDPPLNEDRKIEAKDNRGIAVEESIIPLQVKDKEDQDLPNLYTLTIKTDVHGVKDSLETIIYHP